VAIFPNAVSTLWRVGKLFVLQSVSDGMVLCRKRRGAINARQLAYLERYHPKSRLKSRSKNGHNSCRLMWPCLRRDDRCRSSLAVVPLRDPWLLSVCSAFTLCAVMNTVSLHPHSALDLPETVRLLFAVWFFQLIGGALLLRILVRRVWLSYSKICIFVVFFGCSNDRLYMLMDVLISPNQDRFTMAITKSLTYSQLSGTKLPSGLKCIKI